MEIPKDLKKDDDAMYTLSDFKAIFHVLNVVIKNLLGLLKYKI